MRSILGRVFFRWGGQEDLTTARGGPSSELTEGDIETYYLKVIEDGLKQLLVPPDALSLSVKRVATRLDGRVSFAGFVRVLKWDSAFTPVILQNMSVIDDRVRKFAAMSVLLERTHFAGIWFQSTSSTEGAPLALMAAPPNSLIHGVR